MKNLLEHLEVRMDDFKIKKKFYILYILCVLVPLLVTDSVVFSIVRQSEHESQEHEMANIANSVSYSITSSVDNAAEIAKSIYTSKAVDEFLTTQYANSMEYVVEYQKFFRNSLFESGLGRDDIIVTMYADNDTLINGGNVANINTIENTNYYRYMKSNELNRCVYFDYDSSKAPAVKAERKMLFLQRMDFFPTEGWKKVIVVQFNYGNMIRSLEKMNLDTDVYVCKDNKILLSNGESASLSKDFEDFEQMSGVGYSQTVNLCGMNLDIYVMKTQGKVWEELRRNLGLIIFLLFINAVLPILLVRGFNRSFTKRISELSRVFEKVDSEKLVSIANARGKDEIGSLMRNYNRMVARTNELIQIVFKNKIQEQQMMVARQNAELLALHSQINPHFLFNALESIRMHSLLKQEHETADMVEKLAVMQRQYVEWGDDSIEVSREMEFVKAYLGLQKYRFGDRLNYSLEVDESCLDKKIPKLTLVTFVENACVHGIESKTAPGWIFVRITEENQCLCIEVEDTGSGMEESAMEELKDKMQHACIEMLKEKGRVGMINACLRLKMISEEQVRFDLEGEIGVGTMVSIRIPIQFV